MGWALVTLGLVVGAVAAMLVTMRGIHRATDELAHYRLSVRFWALLAALGVALVFAFAYPLRMIAGAGMEGWLLSDSGLVTAALMGILPAVVVFAGLRNATVLAHAHRRRRRALRTGTSIAARVVDRSRRLLAHDIMAVTVEADLPEAREATDLAYRSRDPERVRTHRFVEMCPTDHWSRFEPGARVTLRYLPDDPRTFAVMLFES
jgi:hypothetical protein